MEIKLSKAAAKFLKKLNVEKIAIQIALKIKALGAQGHLNDSRPLKGSLEEYHRIDIGEYRIIYKIIEEAEEKEQRRELSIAIIGKRNDGEVYKMIERKK